LFLNNLVLVLVLVLASRYLKGAQPVGLGAAGFGGRGAAAGGGGVLLIG